MMKIKSKYAGLISRVWISASMSLSISFFMSIINKVPLDRFLVSWLSSAIMGMIVGIPLASIYVPNILKAVENMTDDEQDKQNEES